jgi:hypothetical protein
MFYATLLTGHQPTIPTTGRWLAALGTLAAGRYSGRPVSHV